MTIYCIAQARDISPQKLKDYQQHAPEALKKHDGSLVGKSNNLLSMEKLQSGQDLVVILSFPTAEKARAWRDDPALAHIHDLRNASGHWTIDLLQQ